MTLGQTDRIAALELTACAGNWSQDYYDGVRIALARGARPCVAAGQQIRAGWLRGLEMRRRDCSILPSASVPASLVYA